MTLSQDELFFFIAQERIRAKDYERSLSLQSPIDNQGGDLPIYLNKAKPEIARQFVPGIPFPRLGLVVDLVA